MKRYILTSILLFNTLNAIEIPTEKVKQQSFSETIKLNSQIVQLRSDKEQVMARMGGRVSRYLVKEGDSIRKGQVVALVSSLELASYKTELSSLKKQLLIVNKNYNMVKKLYDIGVESLQNLNIQEEERNAVLSKIEAIKAKQALMGTKSDSYKVYAQNSGRVEEILAPKSSVVDANTPLLSIAKGKESFLIKSYIPLKYVNEIDVGQKGTLLYGTKSYKMHITQILPKLDEKSQQMVVLSKLDEPVKNLFVNAFVASKLDIGASKRYLAVKKSALSFFNNEWVVFVPEEHHEEDNHDEHETRRGRAMSLPDAHHEEEHEDDDHDHEKHGKEEHEKEAHDEHGHEEHEEVPYDIRVVKIIKQNSKWVAIEGLHEGDEYVSDKSYYVKSLLLKSSLGGHGH